MLDFPTRVDVFKCTSDDWYGSYKLRTAYTGNTEQMLVTVSFCQTGPNPPTNGDWRVCVWGNDDCGMELDFNDAAKAWQCFQDVIQLEDVTFESLKERGFISA
jgi:hypothetical protein